MTTFWILAVIFATLIGYTIVELWIESGGGRLVEFARLYRLYRNHYPCLAAARYAWAVTTSNTQRKKD